MSHQTTDNVHVTTQPIQFGNSDTASVLPGRCQCCLKLRPPLQRIGALAGLNLNVFAQGLYPFGLSEMSQRLSLGFNSKARASLPCGGNADVKERFIRASGKIHQ